MATKDNIKNDDNIDDSYGNNDGIRDSKDINFDLKNSIKNNLYITIPANVNGVNYSNYIVDDPSKIKNNVILYSDDMTIAEKLSLLIQMKDNIRNQIINDLKLKTNDDFYYSNGKEKIPFVAYWKIIQPLEQNTYIKLTPSATTLSWCKNATIKATLYDESNTPINGDLVSNFDGTHYTTNGSYTFTIPAQSGPGNKTYKVQYNGSIQQYKSCSNNITLTFTKDTPTLKALSKNSIYQGYHAQYQLLNSQGKAIKNANVQVKIGSGSWKTYTTNSQGIVSISITSKTTVHYKFNETSLYNAVSEKSQSFTIKANETKSKCTGTMTQSPTSRTKPYQTWSDLYSDCTTSNYLRCGHESTGYNDSRTLGSASGTFHQPSVLIKSNIDLGVPQGSIIKSVHVKWAEKQTNGPSSSTSYTSFINIKKVKLSTSGAITYSKEINTNSGGSSYGGKWVSHDLSLGTNFDTTKKVTLKLAYGPNESGNTGTIYVKGPQIIVEYVPAE